MVQAPPWQVPPGGVLLIDADCPLCQRSRLFLEAHAAPDSFDTVPLGSPAGRAWSTWCRRDPDDRSTLVLVRADGCRERSSAVLEALRHTQGRVRTLGAARVVPRPVRDAVYDLVARHRHRLGLAMPDAARAGLVTTLAEGRRRAAARLDD